MVGIFMYIFFVFIFPLVDNIYVLEKSGLAFYHKPYSFYLFLLFVLFFYVD